MKLKNKVAIVTGAGSGNGRAIALRLFEEGAIVVVADMNEAGANETISQAPEGSKAMVVKVDVTQKDQVDSMVAQTIQEFGKVDILVNNAGIVAFTPFLELDEKEWDKVHDVNLKAPFFCSQAVAKEMIKAGNGGRIINITSVEAHRVVSSSGHCQPHYNSSKGGLHMLTKAIALELSSHGITCNAVAPGVVQTPFTEKGLEIPEVKEWVLERLPVGRIGQPQDVANAVLFLAQDEASYVTGSTLVVDGGWTIH
ncbi:hypothetical protein AN963_07030 [Brevibacillus choshinensis]|uniref:Short-chain dehydrogenase n=1 Tax=Brevibacillus choshinensis TaxID=54911 RepID=A0ABR5ND53_BRECH|nr:SDR family oxidoreductase [Brevibacillus choshinensis]KQL49491.1 hypothetical protein AN963_07030 [Brevibacillus choshinensis]